MQQAARLIKGVMFLVLQTANGWTSEPMGTNPMKLFRAVFLCIASTFAFSQETLHLDLLSPGDIVQRNGSSYTIENNEFQNIREFAKIGPTSGTLVLYGGGDLSNEMLQVFTDLVGGVDSKIVAITTAACWAEILDTDNDYLGHLASHGFSDIEVIHTRDVEVANSKAFSDKLNGASGVWIGGGGPECLLAPYLHTQFHESLRGFLHEGGVIAGTSAGAMVLGSYYQANHGEPVRVGRIEFEGFGFLNNVTIAAHIDTFEKGFSEQVLKVIDNYYPGLLGIGLAENTAAIVKGDLLSVIGLGGVRIYDGQNTKSLTDGEEYDLARRR